MPSPTKENRSSGSAAKRRASRALEPSPAKKQAKPKSKPAKKDRRRVSFAPDPELTMVHHFLKDDDYNSNSEGGRVEVAAYEEPTVQHQPAAGAQHPALAGAPDGAYRPGFWNKTVPENSPMSMGGMDGPLPGLPDSPGSVSMELTQPTLPVQQQQQQQQHEPGEVTAGLPSLGALAEDDELEAAAEEAQLEAAAAPVHQPGEVTAALPSLGALADEADEWQQEGDGWAGFPLPADAGANVTANITAALPGLGSLVVEDEEATAGMDLTVPAGRVLEHHAQQQQLAEAEEAQLQASPAPTMLAAAPSPAPTAVVAPSPAAAAAPSPAPAVAVAPSPAPTAVVQEEQEAQQPAAEVEPTAPVATARLSSGTDELAVAEAAEAAKATQMNKWGFAPGQEDTLDINLEMHGRMIMGDQTFNRMYCDNTTGDSRYAAPVDDTGNSLLVKDGEGEGQQAAAAAAATAAASPGLRHEAAAAAAAAAAPSPAGPFGRASPAGPFGRAPAPAFLPPYLQAPAASGGAPSDHPALVQSPTVTNSSLGTLETRRVSVDARRMSINSRRFSMQDATGRLLADDDASLGGTGGLTGGLHAHPAGHPAAHLATVAEAPGSAGLSPASFADGPASGTRSRRRSSGAQFLGRDVTDRLLVDDSLEGEEDPQGPLADLKRQMRMLSQGSPVAAPGASQAAAVAAAAAEAAAAEEQQVVAEQEMADAEGEAAEAAPPAKTPRAAVSMGYADSHNPATLRLLRSGGTTRLLAETGSLGGSGEEEEEDEGLAEALAGGAAARDMGAGGDGGMTARTGGTTKLLADMTMASSVGAKLLGRGAQGTPELPHGPGNDGLTDYSLGLDEFERPPEPELLDAQQAAAQAAAEEAAMAEAAAAEAQDYQQLQEEAAAEAVAAAAGDEYASPAVLAAAGYPLDAAPGSAGIPGGPKLARTPVPARAASQPPRSAHGTPHSQARSYRSGQAAAAQHQLAQHQATPGTHGTHRLARTPGSVHFAAAAYPLDADMTADNQIPGGPKLARTPVGRTPMGRTPATGGALLAAPGSAVAQHYPGSARAVHFAAAPGSASLPRYPGSAVAAHRGGLTPQYAPPPMTFQDFARLAEVQFLDNLRRGASINYADLQPNPVPQSLGEAYRLLTIIAPQVTTLENGIRILQEEVQARRVSAAEAEQQVGQVNPLAFQRAAAADDEQLEALREQAGLLKKVCRQKAVYCLKDVRRQMEESRGGRLHRNLEALQADLAAVQAGREQLEGVARTAHQFVAEQQRRMVADGEAREAEAGRRAGVAAMRRATEEEGAANAARRAQLAEAQERVARLREEHAALHREREALRARTDALQMTLMQSQGRDAALGTESSPAAILKKLEELDVLRSCVGWQLESAAEDPVSGEAALRLADLFRLRLNISRAGASAAVEALPEGESKVPADCRAMLAALAGCPADADAPPARVEVAECSGATVAALVQATTARLARVADLAAELDGLRLAFPALTDVTYGPDGTLSLSFVNLDAEVKFGVSLHLPASYPLGPVHTSTRIWFDGEGQVTEAGIGAAVAAAPEGPGRLRAICRELSRLAREALPRPAQPQGDAAFHSGWQNPLFGSAPTLSAQS